MGLVGFPHSRGKTKFAMVSMEIQPAVKPLPSGSADTHTHTVQCSAFTMMHMHKLPSIKVHRNVSEYIRKHKKQC